MWINFINLQMCPALWGLLVISMLRSKPSPQLLMHFLFPTSLVICLNHIRILLLILHHIWIWNSNFDVDVQLPKGILTPKSQRSYGKFQKFWLQVEHFCFGNSWISWMLAETMASTFREHFPHYVANGFQVLVVLKH